MSDEPSDLPALGTARGEVPLRAVPDAPPAPAPEPTKAATPAPVTPRPFDEFLREQRRGGVMHDAGVALQKLVTAIEATGKGGSLTITLKLKPDDKYGTAVEVADSIVVKVPEPNKPSSLFFMDGSHNLVRHDPAAMQIPFPEGNDDD